MGHDEERSLAEAGDRDLPGERLSVPVFQDVAEPEAERETKGEPDAARIGAIEPEPSPGVDQRVRVVVKGADDAVVVLPRRVSRARRADALHGGEGDEEAEP